MTRIRILEDYTMDGTPAIRTGTLIENATLIEDGEVAYYLHPKTGEDWLSFEEDFEVVENG